MDKSVGIKELKDTASWTCKIEDLHGKEIVGTYKQVLKVLVTHLIVGFKNQIYHKYQSKIS